MIPDPAIADAPVKGWRGGALLCAVLLLWLITRPYFGTIADARFYMVEALNAADPARFAGDLYFGFGSQGKFSAFPWLYQPFLPAFGVGVTSIILTVAGQMLWLFGLFRLARMLVGGKVMWLSIAVVIGMLNIYAPYFGYGEGYLTARLFAEAFVLLALSLLSTRPIRAFLLLALSAVLHPLMALPGVAVALVYLAIGQPVWWAVIGGGAALAGMLGLADIEPFGNLFRIIDPEWFAVIKERCMPCLLTSWPTEAFLQTAWALIWAILALLLVDPRHRRFLLAVLLVGVGGVAVAVLGGDVLHNALTVQVQPWRSLWLLQIVSRIYLPLVLMAVLARTSLDTFRWTTVLTITLILASSVIRLVRIPDSAEFTPTSLVLMAAALVLIAAQLLPQGQMRRQRAAMISALAGFALVAVALMRWDLRSPGTRYLESPEPAPKDLAALLPDNASVYWEGGLEMLWLRLKRPSYFSCDQGTGVMFYRDTAMAYRHRTASFWPLRVGDFGQPDSCPGLDVRATQERNRAGLQKLCRQERKLDYVVLAQPLEGVASKMWKSPVRFQDIQASSGKSFARAADRFYIYDCAAMR